jgi:hypothetical protein
MNRKSLAIVFGIAALAAAGFGLRTGAKGTTVVPEVAAVESKPANASPPAVAELPKPAASADHIEKLKSESQANPDENVRRLSRDLLAMYDRNEELTRAYDETHRLYVERFNKDASKEELATFQQHLNELMEELKVSANDIYLGTVRWNDAFVAERMAALHIGDAKGR